MTRVGDDGTVTDITPPKDQTQVGLVSGGDRVWVALPALGAYGFTPISLVAADSPGDSISLPEGLVPLAGRGDTIIGQYFDGSAPSGLFGVVDAETGELVQRFGDRAATDARTIVNAAVGGDYLVAAPWVCGGACTLRRYNFATGEQHSVELDSASDHILASGAVAVSPDGSVAATALYDQPPSPAPFDPDPPPSTGPSGTLRIGLIDLDNGSVRTLPGVTLGPLQTVALTFTPDGTWLLTAISEGDATRLLLYTADGDGPYDPQLTVPGAVVWPLVIDAS